MNKYFLGKNVNCKINNIAGITSNDLDNNSILLELDNNNYIIISSSIVSFKLNKPILEFYSPVGNNLVPYPFAIGKNNIYIFEGNQIFKLKYDDYIDITQDENIYNISSNFYDNSYDFDSKYKKIKLCVIQNRLSF